jgi:hypothetical protein
MFSLLDEYRLGLVWQTDSSHLISQLLPSQGDIYMPVYSKAL